MKRCQPQHDGALRVPGTCGVVSMNGIHCASQRLFELCAPSFGPTGATRLLFEPPHAPVITRDVSALLPMLLRHELPPIARFLVEIAMKNVFASVGDGTSEFVLLVHLIISEVHALTQKNHGGRHQPTWGQDQQDEEEQIEEQEQEEANDIKTNRRLYANAFGELRRRIASQPEVFFECFGHYPALHLDCLRLDHVDSDWNSQSESESESDSDSDVDFESLKEVPANTRSTVHPPARALRNGLRSVLHTSISGSFDPQVVQFLSQLVLKWVLTSLEKGSSDPSSSHRPVNNGSSGQRHRLFRHVDHMVVQLANLLVFAPSSSVFESFALAPNQFLLGRTLVTTQRNMFPITKMTNVQFIALSGVSLAHASSSGSKQHVTVQFPGSQAAKTHRLQEARHQFLCQWIQVVASRFRVKLLLCTEAIPAQVAEICASFGVACVPFVEQQELDTLCRLSGIVPVVDVLQMVEASNVGVNHAPLRTVRIDAGRHGLLFTSLSPLVTQAQPRQHPMPPIPQVVLRAPSRDIYKQYHMAIAKMLRVLRCLFEDGSLQHPGNQQVVWVAPGAGAMELALAQTLHRLAVNATNDITAGASSGQLATTSDAVSRGLVALVQVLHQNLSAQTAALGNRQLQQKKSQREFLVQMAAFTADFQHCNTIEERASVSKVQPLPLSSPQPSKESEYATRVDKKGSESFTRGSGFSFVLHGQSTSLRMAGCKHHGHRFGRANDDDSISIPVVEWQDPLRFGIVHPIQRLPKLLDLVLATLEQLFRLDAIVKVKSTKALPTIEGEV